MLAAAVEMTVLALSDNHFGTSTAGSGDVLLLAPEFPSRLEIVARGHQVELVRSLHR